MGYYAAGFEVTGIDIKPQPNYPFHFYQADALEFPLEGYDAYHASPPCQAYCAYNRNGASSTKHPRLIEPIRERLIATGKPYVIENIYKAPLQAHIMLCGSMFGLRVRRHRYFEAPCLPLLCVPYSCNHKLTVSSGELVGVYSRGGKGPRHGRGVREAKPKVAKLTPFQAMEIYWMTFSELKEALPPKYTQFIGEYLLDVV